MKEYTALHYVRDHMGILHTPGEIFESEYEDAAEERLLRLGAILNNVEGVRDEAENESVRESEEANETESDDDTDVSNMIDVMEGIAAKPTKRGRKK